MTTTDAGTRLADDLALLDLAVSAFDGGVGSVDSTTVEEATLALADLRGHIQTLRQCEAGLERWIAACFKAEGWRDPHELPGIGMVEVRRSKGRTQWEHDRVRADWLNAYMASVGGEAPTPAEVRDAFLKVASVSQYKVTGLRDLGLDPGDYCDEQPGTPKVLIA